MSITVTELEIDDTTISFITNKESTPRVITPTEHSIHHYLLKSAPRRQSLPSEDAHHTNTVPLEVSSETTQHPKYNSEVLSRETAEVNSISSSSQNITTCIAGSSEESSQNTGEVNNMSSSKQNITTHTSGSSEESNQNTGEVNNMSSSKQNITTHTSVSSEESNQNTGEVNSMSSSKQNISTHTSVSSEESNQNTGEVNSISSSKQNNTTHTSGSSEESNQNTGEVSNMSSPTKNITSHITWSSENSSQNNGENKSTSSSKQNITTHTSGSSEESSQKSDSIYFSTSSTQNITTHIAGLSEESSQNSGEVNSMLSSKQNISTHTSVSSEESNQNTGEVNSMSSSKQNITTHTSVSSEESNQNTGEVNSMSSSKQNISTHTSVSSEESNQNTGEVNSMSSSKQNITTHTSVSSEESNQNTGEVNRMSSSKQNITTHTSESSEESNQNTGEVNSMSSSKQNITTHTSGSSEESSQKSDSIYFSSSSTQNITTHTSGSSEECNQNTAGEIVVSVEAHGSDMNGVEEYVSTNILIAKHGKDARSKDNNFTNKADLPDYVPIPSVAITVSSESRRDISQDIPDVNTEQLESRLTHIGVLKEEICATVVKNVEISDNGTLNSPDIETPVVLHGKHDINSPELELNIENLTSSENITENSNDNTSEIETLEDNNGLDLCEIRTVTVIENSQHHYVILPEYLNILIDGMFVCGDTYSPIDSKPEWFNEDKFCRGQRVAMKYFFGLVYAEMLSLLMILSFPDGLGPLIFTGNSDTPFKSFKRYLSTVARVRSWYLDDIWKTDTEGHKNVKIVRSMHEAVRKRLHSISPQEVSKKLSLAESSSDRNQPTELWSPLQNILRDDFQGSCPYPFQNQCPFLGHRENRVFINQMDMALTQFGFVGLFILYPSNFGAHGITDEDLEGFIHVWQCLGYMLGMEDKYNFCNGDLETVRKRSRDMIRFWVKPSLREVTRDWEHMTRCVVEGISYYVSGVTFEVSLMYLCNMLGIYTPRLTAALTFTQKLMCYITSFTLWILMRIPGALRFYNWLLRAAIARALEASPEQLRKLEQRKYPYENNVSCSRL